MRYVAADSRAEAKDWADAMAAAIATATPMSCKRQLLKGRKSRARSRKDMRRRVLRREKSPHSLVVDCAWRRSRTQHSALSTQHSVLSTQYSVLRTQHFLNLI